MRLKRVEFELEVPEVPEGDGFVCGAGGQDELGVGVEAQAVDLGGVRVHGVGGLVVGGGARVPGGNCIKIGLPGKLGPNSIEKKHA